MSLSSQFSRVQPIGQRTENRTSTTEAKEEHEGERNFVQAQA